MSALQEETLVLANGFKLPRVGLGTFRACTTVASDAVSSAIAAGIRHIDTATIYKELVLASKQATTTKPPKHEGVQNHEDVLEGVRRSGVARQELVITSKISPYQIGTDATRTAWQSLADLSPDVLLIHWPGAARLPPSSPLNAQKRLETWRVLEEWYLEGRVRAIGVSNFTAAHVQQLADVATVPPMVNQIEVHPRFPQTELRQLCKSLGVATVAYASLGCGQLLHNPTVLAVAGRCLRSPAQVLLRWGLQQGCAVIPKSVQEGRIAEFSPAQLLTWRLEDQDMAALDSLADGFKYCWDPKDVL